MGWYNVCKQWAFGPRETLERFSLRRKHWLGVVRPNAIIGRDRHRRGFPGNNNNNNNNNGVQLRTVGQMEAAQPRTPLAYSLRSDARSGFVRAHGSTHGTGLALPCGPSARGCPGTVKGHEAMDYQHR